MKRTGGGGVQIDRDALVCALEAHPLVEDCVVLWRPNSRERDECVAYLVATGSFTPAVFDAFLQQEHPTLARPKSYVPIAAVPVTDAGEIDETALAALEVIDAELVGAWEARLGAAAGVREVAVIAQPYAPPATPLHLSELGLGWRRGGTDEQQTAIAGVPARSSVAGGRRDWHSDVDAKSDNDQSDASTADLSSAENRPLAFSDGGSLLIPGTAPKTLTEALLRAAQECPAHGITYVRGDGSELRQTYPAVLKRAKSILAGLRRSGLKEGDRVILQVDTIEDHVPAFWACVLGGIIPVTVAVPPSYGERNAVVNKLFNTWELLGHPAILTSNRIVADVLSLEALLGIHDLFVLSVDDLKLTPPTHDICSSKPSDVVFFQLTSGSTGIPKCIQETHRGIISHIHAAQQFNGYTRDDVAMNWLPMDHVVPILTIHLRCVYLGCDQVHAPPNRILSNPLTWLDLLEKHHVTDTWSPNFGFKLVTDHLSEGGQPTRRWDLSSVRHWMNAGEQVTLPVIRQFLEQVEAFGVRADAMQPAFGMAEACTCMTYQNQFSVATGVRRFLKSSLAGLLREAGVDAVDTISFIDLGPPVPGVQIRITDEHDHVVPEGKIGRFQIRGNVITPGYLSNDAANRDAFVGDGWFNSGDLGFILDGRLTLTGREKEMIIVRGANFYCYEIEDVVNAIPGVEPTFAAACAIDDPGFGTEGLAIFFVPKPSEIDEQIRLIQTIKTQVGSNLGISPAVVVPLVKSKFPKTTSGKIQRTQLTKELLAGRFQAVLKQVDLHARNENTLPNWFLRPVWRRQEPRLVESPDGPTLVMADEQGLATALCASIRQRGEVCVEVRRGAGFVRLGVHRYEIAPDVAADYHRLLASCAADQINIARIVHLWSYAPHDGALPTHASVGTAEAVGVMSVLGLARALAASRETRRQALRMLMVSSHTQAVRPDDAIACERVSVLGLLPALAAEQPGLTCSHLDLPLDGLVGHVAAIQRELQSHPDREVAYRDGHRWVRKIERVDFRAGPAGPLPFEPGGLYLITGGLGGAGVEIAKHLLTEYHARLLLLGRTPLPSTVGRDETADVTRLEAYRLLEGLPGAVSYAAADLTDVAAVRAAIAEAQSRWPGPLKGILHLAGVYQERALDEETPETVRPVLAPKILGACTLHQVLAEHPEAWIASFSSAITFSGGAMVGAYAAANRFLEGLSEAQRRTGIRSHCLSWSSWDGVGMSRGYAGKAPLQARGFRDMAPGQAVVSLCVGLQRDAALLFVGLDPEHPYVRRSLAGESPRAQHVTAFVVRSDDARVSDDFETLQVEDRWGTASRCDVISVATLPRTPAGTIDRARLVQAATGAADRVSPRTDWEQRVAGLWRDTLGATSLSVDDNFFALGGHSLLAAQVLARVKERWGIELPLRALFEAPTMADLAARLDAAAAVPGREPALTPVSRDKPLPLSFAQQRLWFIDRLESGGSSNNIPCAFRLSGPLDRSALERSLSEIVRRHDALRTVFPADMGVPIQRIAPNSALPLVTVDLRGLAGSAREIEAGRLAAADAQAPFDLAHGPLLRTTLLQLDERTHWLLITLHHIVSDGWSLGVFSRELNSLYEAFTTGRPSPLEPLAIQFADYAVWQREWLRGERLETQLAYWKRQLAGAPTLLTLPTDRPRPAAQSHRGTHRSFSLSRALSRRLSDVSQQEGITLFMTLLATFQVLLHKYSGQDEFIVSTAAANRDRTETEGLIACLINVLLLRADLSGNLTFRDLLQRVRETALGAYTHQDLPFEKLVEELQPERSLSYNPLTQVMFVFLTTPPNRLALTGLTVDPLDVTDAATPYDLQLHMWEADGQLAGMLHYSTDLFDETTIERLIGHLETVLDAAVRDLDRSLARLPLLTAAERRRMLVEWNATEQPFPSDCCLHELIEQQADRKADALAVVCGDAQLTYGQLQDRSNQLAHHLQRFGVGADVLVGVCLERSTDLIVAILGILKAGGAYVPMDPSFPQERLRYMLDDSRAAVLLTQDSLRARFTECPVVLCLDADWPVIERESIGSCSSERTPEHLAYVIYTSGSTGKPKGVEIPQRAVVNFLHSMQSTPGLTDQDRLLAVTTLSFDIAALEIFLPLVVGATLVLASSSIASDGFALTRTLSEQRITAMQATPATWSMLLQAGWTGDAQFRILCGGEATSSQLVDDLLQRCGELWNLYGPTETTIWSTVARIEPGDRRITIGRPIANTTLFVLDRHLEPLPVGVPGELHIGGTGLARGYRNRPRLTAETFVLNPFSSDAGSRLYKTGDLVKYLPDGRLEFLGRSDNQVKIHGFRIELGEIESVLSTHLDVQEVAVIAREDAPGDKRLVAYVSFRNEDSPSGSELQRFLKPMLPAYMIPSAFVVLESLPRTLNGKIDRKKLPAPSTSRPEFSAAFVPPRSRTEIELADLWRGVIGVQQVGVHDDFFALGGHSLLATQVLARINSQWGIELPLRALFEAPTVAGLAARLESAPKGVTSEPSLAPVPRVKPLPLSFAQQRLWFVDQLEPGNSSYNLPGAYWLDGPLNVDALERSLAAIVSRHESLRTCFPTVGGQPVQRISRDGTVQLAIGDLTSLPKAEREDAARRRADAEAQRPFNLANGPLLRTSLVRIASDRHLLLVTMHHIVSDGWSLGVFNEELQSLYDAFGRGEASPLPPLPIQYADFSEWQRACLNGDRLNEDLAYWKHNLAGVPTVVTLPLDHARPAVQTFRGRELRFTLPLDVSERVKALSRGENVTVFMTLMAAFQVLLHRYSGQEQFIVSTGVANRTRRETERLIGCLINILLLKADLTDGPTFRQVLQRVREDALGGYAHQDLPFEQLVEALQPERDLSYNPLTQVMFVLLDAPMDRLDLANLRVTPFDVESISSQYDIVLHMWETPKGFGGFWHFNSAIFDQASVERMMGHLETLLRSVTAEPDVRVLDAPLLSEAERRRMLVEWNATEEPFPDGACLHELFERQVDRDPHAVAVLFDEQQLTYGELEARANQLANYLRRRGVGPDVLVGLCVERSIELVVGVLGILKAGGGYVPLDPAYPEDRLRLMLDDSLPPILLTQEHIRSTLPATRGEVVSLDASWPEIARESSTRPVSGVTARHLCYVIYTSGSTGTPKGIALEHRGVVNNIVDLNHRHGVGPVDRVLALSSLSFDMCVYEILGTLEAGGAIVMPTPREWREPAAWAVLARRHTVTVWNSAPALLKMFVDYVENRPELWPSAMHLAILGGDWVPVSLPGRVRAVAPRIRVIVLGGATEASIHSIIFPVDQVDPSWKSIPYGKPMYNQKAYILNASLQPAPIGVPGELYLGGIGLGRGYFNRPDQTAERFLPSPFVQGERIYRTGDLACYGADGSIELIGRVDYQVKLRGLRIECGEIEAVMRRHPAVREAVVVAQDYAGGDKRLVAYIRPNDVAVRTYQTSTGQGASRDRLIEDLRSFARTKLPDYMVPSGFVLVPELPLSPNGKVDRKALAALQVVSGSREVVQPEGADQECIAEIFESVLGLPTVSANDSFFHIGGHSLLAAQVVARVRDAFGVDLPLRTIFERPTVAQLASAIRQTAQHRGEPARPPLVATARDVEPPLGFVQEGLWFLEGLLPGTSAYNITPSFRLTGTLDHAVLGRALAEMVRRHEILRTTLVLSDEHPVQIIAPPHRDPLRIVDLRHLPADGREPEAMRLADAESRSPFDLSRGPLFRATLLQIDDCDHLLHLALHHVIADGVSFEVLGRELGVLYEAFAGGLPSPLPALPIQFADYAMWERQWLQGHALEELNTFWATALAGAPHKLELPTDHPRPSVQTLHGARHFFELSRSRSSAVDQLCRAEGATAFMTLLAAFDVLLYAYAGVEDIVVGAPFANRVDPATQSLIGVFVNTLPLRARVSPGGSFRGLLAQVRETVLTAEAHQSLPLEKIVQAVRPPRDLSRNPLFQVDFRVRPTASAFPFRLPGIVSELVVSDAVTSKFDLALELWLDRAVLKGFLEYSTDLFEAATIRRMARAFDKLLAALLAQPDTPIRDLEIVEAMAETGREVAGRQSIVSRDSLMTAVRRAKRRGVAVKEEPGGHL